MFIKIISATTLSFLFCNQNYSYSLVKATQSVTTTIVASPDLIKKFESLKFWSKASLVIPFLLPFLHPLIIRTFCSKPSQRVQNLIKKICSECDMDGANMHIHHTIREGLIMQGVGNGVIAIDQSAAEAIDMPNSANPNFIASVPVIMRHEAGHVKEQHGLKISLIVGIAFALSYLSLEKLIEKTKLAYLFTQPTTQREYTKTIILFNLRDLIALLPAACLYFPLNRYFERRADNHAIVYTKRAAEAEATTALTKNSHNPKEEAPRAFIKKAEELEAFANFFEFLASNAKLQRNSFRAQYFSDPLHPCIFERIDNFRAAAQGLRKQATQQQAVQPTQKTSNTQPAAASEYTIHVFDTITFDMREKPPFQLYGVLQGHRPN